MSPGVNRRGRSGQAVPTSGSYVTDLTPHQGPTQNIRFSHWILLLGMEQGQSLYKELLCFGVQKGVPEWWWTREEVRRMDTVDLQLNFFIFIFYFWPCWVFVTVWGLSLVATHGLLFLWLTGLVALPHVGSQILNHRWNPRPLYWKGDSPLLGHQG